jgi:TetR/AcrR family transcriptional repressor of nem operon
MRYPDDQKQHTHDRIVKAASRRFRRNGESNVGIADLMQELKLTHGGFYKHFNSKQALFIESIDRAFEERGQRLEEVIRKARPGDELRTMITSYLSMEHCSSADEGCPVAALASDIGRLPRAVRTRFDKAVRNHAQRFARFLPGSTNTEKRRNFGILFSGMSGTLSLARAISDDEMRKGILDAAREFYLRCFCSK